MTENQMSKTPEGIKQEIIKKAQLDKDFKKALVDNPKEILGQLGVQFSEEVEVKVVEESSKIVYLVLPINPDELTDEQLDSVAGGGCVVHVFDPPCIAKGCGCWNSWYNGN